MVRGNQVGWHRKWSNAGKMESLCCQERKNNVKITGYSGVKCCWEGER